MYSDMSMRIRLSSFSNRYCGQGAGQLGLADAGRAQEDERADGPLGVLQAGARAADGLGDGDDGLVLADDPLVQLVLHAEAASASRPPPGGDTGMPVIEKTICGDLVLVHRAAWRPCAVSCQLLVQLARRCSSSSLLAALQLVRLVVLPVVRQAVQLLLDGVQLDLGVAQVLRRHGAAQADTGRGLVDHVDGLVRQEPVGDVAVGEPRGGVQRLVGDLDLVVLLVARRAGPSGSRWRRPPTAP